LLQHSSFGLLTSSAVDDVVCQHQAIPGSMACIKCSCRSLLHLAYDILHININYSTHIMFYSSLLRILVAYVRAGKSGTVEHIFCRYSRCMPVIALLLAQAFLLACPAAFVKPRAAQHSSGMPTLPAVC
jgi:hypothetical protein